MQAGIEREAHCIGSFGSAISNRSPTFHSCKQKVFWDFGENREGDSLSLRPLPRVDLVVSTDTELSSQLSHEHAKELDTSVVVLGCFSPHA